MTNLEAARRAEQEFGAGIIVIQKTSAEYAREKNPPPCPSVAVNGTLIVRNDTVTYEGLKAAILSGRQ
jgi:hypothetical protein